jgi:hypothetical protein
MIDNIAQNAAGVQIEIFETRVDFFMTYILSVCLTGPFSGERYQPTAPN